MIRPKFAMQCPHCDNEEFNFVYNTEIDEFVIVCANCGNHLAKVGRWSLDFDVDKKVDGVDE